MLEHSVIVRQRVDLSPHVAMLTLAAKSGSLPHYTPGAHIDVHVGDAGIRQYSLCNAEIDGTYRIAIQREDSGRGGSRWLHQMACEGAMLNVSAPRNNFELVQGAPAVLLAGGIGLTPLLGMAHALKKGTQPWALHYFARSRAKAVLLDHMTQAFGPAFTAHFDDEAPKLFTELAGAHYYICGPGGFMDAWRAKLGRINPALIHTESFKNVADLTGGSFEVVAQRSGKRVQVAPNETIVEALARVGLHLETSCREGVCGTCVTKLISGEADHRDQVLRPKQRDKMIAPCCSRAKSPTLVLDC